MADFHFLRPLWLLAIIALIYLIWQLKKLRIASSAWHKVIPKHLTSMLLSNEDNKKPISLLIPSIIGLLIIVAMAGPTWQKIPQPVFEVERGSVIVMDMSFSMLATDIKPNRLTMARFKAMDLVKEINEGEIGLVAYAGDAFIISPLTADINNINLLLPSLSPEIMPELGSNPYPALLLANDMLQNSGHLAGDIYWITDGIDMDELQDINDFVAKHDHRVNILGVGTEQGAPITLSNGELMKDRGGNIVIPKINLQMLSGVSSRSSGLFSPITADESDIEKLGERPSAQAKDMQSKQDNLGDQWQEAGPYLLLLVLPLMLGYFRRGLLFMPVLFAFALSTTYSPNVKAQEQEQNQAQGKIEGKIEGKVEEKAESSLWDDLWQTSDQQASKKFAQQQYEQAAEQFNDPQWKASSLYKAGKYEEALEEYQKLQDADLGSEETSAYNTLSNYNQANTLAKLGQYDEAIAKYDDVLAEQPEHADALANKALIEQLKQQQEEQDQNQDGDEQQEQNQEQQQSDKNDQQNQDENQQGDSGQQDDQSQSENSEQQQDSQDPQSSDQSDNAKPEQNENGDQNPNDKDSDQQSRDNEQQNGEQNDSEEENQAQAKADTENNNAEQSDEQGAENEQMAGMTDSPTAEEIEANQKHEQLLKKVTDDPHLLLRNKMQLEYQKRRQNRSSIGVKEKW